MSKRADSRYTSGRAKTWLKVKSFTVGDYAVLGVERSSTGIPVALLATLGRNPAYVGNAMVTLPAAERKALLVLRRDHGSAAGPPRLVLPRTRKRPGSARASWLASGISVARTSCGTPRCSRLK